MRYGWFLALVAACAAGPASAATYTVAPNGSDSNNGTSAPFRTFLRGAQALQDGDTLVLREGTYNGGAWIERNNVTIRGEGNVLIDGTNGSRDDCVIFYKVSGITLENLRLRNARRYGAFIVLSQGVTIRNCDASYNGRTGILTGNTDDVLVENCVASYNKGEHGIYFSQSGDRLRARNNRLFNNNACGLQINAVDDPNYNARDTKYDALSKNCWVEGNQIWGNGTKGGAGINLMGVQNSVIINNLIRDNLAGGIAVWNGGWGDAFGGKNNRFAHNTILFDSGRGRYGIQIASGSTGCELKNNIIGCGLGDPLEADEAVDSNFNCFSGPSDNKIVNGGSLAAWQSRSGNDRQSDAGNPRLGSDYRPVSGSAAIDAGQRLANIVIDVDLAGNPRPQGAGPDAGCFEVGGVAPPPNGGGGNPPPPTSGSSSIYTDALASGWTATGRGSKFTLAATNPVQGTRSIGITVTAADGRMDLSGPGLSVTGKSVLKFVMHGGSTGSQALRVQSVVNGVLQTGSLNLMNYGGLPKANQWIEITVPLADLKATGGTLNGLRFFAGKTYRRCYIDNIRVE